MARKTLIVVTTAVLLASFSGAFLWRAAYWQKAGWAGYVYQPVRDDDDAKARVLDSMPRLARSSGEVIVVIPGSPAGKGGLRPGDRIVAVNGVPAADLPALRRLSEQLQAGDSLRVTYARRGGLTSADFRLVSPYEALHVTSGIVVDILVALTFLAISLLVVRMKPDSDRALVFYFMCATAAGMYFLAAFTETEFLDARGVLPTGAAFTSVALMCAYVLSGTLMANLLVHLALIFPRTRPILARNRAILGWVYGAPFLPAIIFAALIGGSFTAARPLLFVPVAAAAATVAALLLVRLVRAARQSGAGSAVARHPGSVIAAIACATFAISPVLRAQSTSGVYAFGVIVGISIILVSFLQGIAYSILTCIAMIRSYRESDVEEKHQVRWPLWGTVAAISLAAFLGIVYFVIAALDPLLLSRHALVALVVGTALKLTYVLIPVSFAFGILKYRLLDIDVIIRKTLVYGGVTGVILFAWLVLVGIVGVLLVSFTGIRTPTVGVAATVVVALLLVPVRNRVQGFIDRRFYQRRSDYQETIRLMSHDISRATALDAALKRAAEAIQQALRARTLLLFAVDAADGNFVLRSKVGIPDEHVGRVRVRAAELAAIAADPVVTLPARGLDDDTAAKLRIFGVRLLARAQVRGETVAYIAAGARLTGEPYDNDDYEFLANASDQVALAIGNLGLRPEEIEYAEALQIQQSLLPSEIPSLPGIAIVGRWEPARVVGGDYYDALRLTDDRVALCIADVAGKGMPAALLMSNLQASVQAIAAPEFPPDEVCRRVRTLVTRSLSGGKFVTFFYGVLDASTRTMTYCNAGHNPPILVRANGDAVRLASGGGAFARLLVKSGYASASVAIEPGDRIVLFTDGVSEARNPAGEELGEERLISLVREHRTTAPELLQRTIVAAVKQYTGDFPQDDVTLVIAGVD